MTLPLVDQTARVRLDDDFGGAGQTGPYVWAASALIAGCALLLARSGDRALRWRATLAALGAALAATGGYLLTTPARWYASTYDGDGLRDRVQGLVSRSLIALQALPGAYLLLIAGLIVLAAALIPSRRHPSNKGEQS